MFNPLSIFKKKEEKEPEVAAEPQEGEEAEESAEESEDGEEKSSKKSKSTKKESAPSSSGPNLVKLSADLEGMKASIEAFGEVRKSLTERISGLNEQIGELRAMILDRDRTIQEIELKSIKASSLVESVQPDKLMIEIQKEDAKFEALKANLEGNEAIMNRIMDELKEVRKKMDFFRGVEEIVKLGEEVRKELIEIKKVEASIHIETDKAQTIYSEVKRKFQEIDVFNDTLQEIKVNMEQNVKDIESLKTRTSDLATKDELDRLVKKVQRYIDALQEINKTSSLTRDVNQLKNILEGLK